jgi:hypothetical protein
MKITRTLEETTKIASTDRDHVEDWLRDADAAQEFFLLDAAVVLVADASAS